MCAAAVLIMSGVLAGCDQRTESLPRDALTVDGLTVYIGVMPAQLVQGHATDRSDPNAMHGGISKNSGAHHLVVALFDAKTGMRIEDARIMAGIGDRSYNHDPERLLEPMQINGSRTYGQFFSMAGTGLWRIHLVIQRPGVAKSTEADFAYEHSTGE